VLAAREPRRLHSRPAVEPVHLQARVFAEDPDGRVVRVAERCLLAGVLVVGGARLGRILVRVQGLDVPPLERLA
jgi:hypothetical protein